MLLCGANLSQVSHRMHSLRVGTFNVNGKLATQDLSPWVQGRSDPSKYIPPLEKLSPFRVDQVVQTSDNAAATDSKQNTRTIIRPLRWLRSVGVR